MINFKAKLDFCIHNYCALPISFLACIQATSSVSSLVITPQTELIWTWVWDFHRENMREHLRKAEADWASCSEARTACVKGVLGCWLSVRYPQLLQLCSVTAPSVSWCSCQSWTLPQCPWHLLVQCLLLYCFLLLLWNYLRSIISWNSLLLNLVLIIIRLLLGGN